MLIRSPPAVIGVTAPRFDPIDDSAGNVEPGSDDSDVSLRGMRILVVDDDRNTREMLGEILGMYDAETRTAESVVTALALYQSWKPSIVVSDLGMPDQDGYDLIRSIRALPGGASTKAIAITGYSRDEDRDLALSAGFNMFLTKPVDLHKLMNLLASIELN